MTDLYISADVEADGPIPGTFSMLSFGLAVAATFDGQSLEPSDPSKQTFYRELKPISDRYNQAALVVSGLDRDRLARDGAEPQAAMRDAARWVAEQAAAAGGARPVLVAYPVVFDWMFMHWYFMHFAGASPFGFSSALDMKTIYQQIAGVTLDQAGRTDLPAQFTSTREHSHNALEDAIEQAEIFNRLFTWKRRIPS